MAIYKYKRINASVDKDKTTVNNNGTVFYTEDKNTASLQLYITFNDKPFDLNNTSMTPVLDLFHQDKSIWIDEPLDIIDAKTGVLQYTIPENIIKHAGNVRAKLFLKNTEESVHVTNFNFFIKDSGVEGAVEKEINVPLLKSTVQKLINENSDLILGEGFKDEVANKFIEYTKTNPEDFKGPQGERGEQGIQGPKGEQGKKGDKGDTGNVGPQGDKGDPFKYTDFTQSQLDALKGPKGDNGVLVSDSGWIELPLLNGVTADTYNNSIKPSYKVIKIGGITIVRLVGMITNLSDNVTFSQIPKEYAIQLKTFYSVAFDRNTNEKLTFTISFNGYLKGQGSITTAKTFILDTMWVA